MKRKREEDKDEDPREAEAKRRHTECAAIIAHVFGPSQDIFLHLFLRDRTHRTAMALGCVNKEWNAAYKQSVHACFTIPLNGYLDAVKEACDEFYAEIAEPDALRRGEIHALKCPALHTLPRHVHPMLYPGAIVRQWLCTHRNSAPECLLNRIFYREFHDNVFEALFPGFRYCVSSYLDGGEGSLDPVSLLPRISIKITRPTVTQWTFHVKSW